MSLLDIFKPEKEVDLEAMTPEQRVAWFQKQKVQLEKEQKQVKSTIRKIIGICELMMPDRFQKYIKMAMPFLEAIMTNPETIHDNINDSMELIAEKAGVPAHHMSITFAKPKGIRNPDGTITPNKDTNAVIRVFNPHFKDFFVVEWNLRLFLRSLNDERFKFTLNDEIREAYNRKPEQTQALK